MPNDSFEIVLFLLQKSSLKIACDIGFSCLIPCNAVIVP